jgi:HK97 family phage major capsid protein
MSQLFLPRNVLAHPVIERRSMPTLLEQRNNLMTELEKVINQAKAETRALTPEEQQQFVTTKDQVTAIDQTLSAQQQADALNKDVVINPNGVTAGATTATTPEEQRAYKEAEDKFLRFIKGESRALDVAGNGGIIPTQIADRIIMRVRELCPIYQMATVFNVGGDLVFPKYDYTGITVGYIADLTALTPNNANFTTIKLQNFIAGALVQISRSLMNRSDFDLVSYIVNAMAMSIANFLENQLLNGVGGANSATGIFVDANTTSLTAGSATALGIDDLISTQLAIPQVYAQNGVWIMNKGIFSGIRKLKDTTGMPYLVQEREGTLANDMGWSLLGRPVYVSQNAPATIATGNKVLAFGDMSGLYVKLAQNVEIQTLNELYATSHATGVVGYLELDSKVVEDQKIAILKMA